MQQVKFNMHGHQLYLSDLLKQLKAAELLLVSYKKKHQPAFDVTADNSRNISTVEEAIHDSATFEWKPDATQPTKSCFKADGLPVQPILIWTREKQVLDPPKHSFTGIKTTWESILAKRSKIRAMGITPEIAAQMNHALGITKLPNGRDFKGGDLERGHYAKGIIWSQAFAADFAGEYEHLRQTHPTWPSASDLFDRFVSPGKESQGNWNFSTRESSSKALHEILIDAGVDPADFATVTKDSAIRALEKLRIKKAVDNAPIYGQLNLYETVVRMLMGVAGMKIHTYDAHGGHIETDAFNGFDALKQLLPPNEREEPKFNDRYRLLNRLMQDPSIAMNEGAIKMMQAAVTQAESSLEDHAQQVTNRYQLGRETTGHRYEITGMDHQILTEGIAALRAFAGGAGPTTPPAPGGTPTHGHP